MYETRGRIGISDVDAYGYMTIGALIHKMQDCCSLQSEDVGYGLKWLQDHHSGWYIVSWQVHIHKLPFMGEEVVTKTMPYYFQGYLGNRNFAVFDKKGDPIAEANSYWILMDLDKVIPYRLPPEMIEAYSIDEELPIAWPNRKIRASEDRKAVYDFTVSPMHVDTNSHMNNSHYVEAARACLPADRFIKELYVDYKMQARLGERVIVSAYERPDGVQVVLENEDKKAYACVEFK